MFVSGKGWEVDSLCVCVCVCNFILIRLFESSFCQFFSSKIGE